MKDSYYIVKAYGLLNTCFPYTQEGKEKLLEYVEYLKESGITTITTELVTIQEVTL